MSYYQIFAYLDKTKQKLEFNINQIPHPRDDFSKDQPYHSTPPKSAYQILLQKQIETRISILNSITRKEREENVNRRGDGSCHH